MIKGIWIFSVLLIYCSFTLAQDVSSQDYAYGRLGVNIPPKTMPFKGKIEQAKPTVILEGTILKLENPHFIMSFQTAPALRLVNLYSKYTMTECLNGSSRVFLFWLDGQQYGQDDFTVVDVSVKDDAGTAKTTIVLASSKLNISVNLDISINDTPQAEFNLSFTDTGGSDRQLRVLFPCFENLQIGDRAEDNYYFFPFKGGICSNKPYNLVSGYSVHTGSLQLLSLYNPSLGGGIYTCIEDSSGRAKTLLLHKKDIDGNEVLGDYKQFAGTFPELNFDYTDVYPTNRGTVMGCYSYPYKFESKGRVSLPTTILGVHGGDFTYALQSYGKWAHTWFRHDIGTPQWFKDTYYNPCVHDIRGNTGWEQGFLRDNKIAMSQIARPYEDILQVAFCWDRTKDDHLGDKRDYSWYRNAGTGDYNYEEEWGGAAGWKDEIEKTHKVGPRVVLYGATQWAVWFYSDVYAQHSDWAVHDKLGKEVHDYWWDLNDNKDRLRMVDFCGQVEEWQDYCAQTNYRIIKETGADGVFTDVMNQIQFCYNSKHKHEEYPGVAAEKLLKKNVAAVRSANTEAVVEIEDFCSDYLLQWVDGCWMKTFYQDLPPVVEDTFDLYSVSFVRFMFPEVKWKDFGPRWIHGARRAFFNGMGYNLSEVENKNDDENAKKITKEQRVDYLIATCQLMKETSDVFSSTDVRCLVPTLQEKVYANYFGANDKKFYTLYNKNDSKIDGKVLKLASDSNKHWVELLYDEPVVYDSVSQTVSASIRPWDVICLAQFCDIIDIQQSDKTIDVRLKSDLAEPAIKVFGDIDDGRAIGNGVEIINDVARIDLGEYNCKKLIIKLYDGKYLADEKIVNLKK